MIEKLKDVSFVKSPKFSRYSFLIAVILFLAAFTALNFSVAFAQKSKPKRKTVTKKKVVPKTELIKSLDDGICIPQESDNVSVIQIDKNSKISLIVQTKDSSKVVSADNPMSSLSKVLSLVDKKSVITVKADPTLDFKSVAKLLTDVTRVNNCINVEASAKAENPYIYVLIEPEPDNVMVKPNPLTLVVFLDEKRNLTLNTEKQGSLDDTSKLTDYLKQIFKEREANGVLRENKNVIETSVIVHSAFTNKFGDIIKIADAIKEAGASPVGLQINEAGSFLLTPAPELKIP